METCNIREMRVHPDSIYVEGEETTCLMRELEKHGREVKDRVGGGIGNFVREREGGGGASQPSSHHPATKWPRIL